METIQKDVLNGSIGTSKQNTNKNVNGAKGSGGNIQTIPNPVQKPTSMSNLIIWNISKAIEHNTYLDLKCGIKAAQERLDRDMRNGNAAIYKYPEEQHLVCALLAWQQLGHTDADSLYQFIESKKTEELSNAETNDVYGNNLPKPLIVASSSINKIHRNDCAKPYPNGPVVRLPLDTKIIMRLDSPCTYPSRTKTTASERNSKIDAACCMDTACAENLAKMDKDTEELRTRAAKLARREAERVELLERAEAAWGDLELGYQRRLRLALEKEDDISNQIKLAIEERNNYKDSCNQLANQLREKGDAAEADQAILKNVEKDLCSLACERLQLSEIATRGEAALTEIQCKAVQLDRDLQFKEEQARRKLLTMDSETESARALMHEAERALRAELSALREQIGNVSNQLLEEDEINTRTKEQIEALRRNKMGMIEDLEGCKAQCDAKMQAVADEVEKRKLQLEQLKDVVLNCRCKQPVDAIVQVKRTPSLAALCRCAPEDKLLDSCSCSSLRSRLISNLLADLFGGLQAELGGVGSQMPCHLLKCLEDKHNWDRASVVKSNLRNFFSKLLVGELDIAIATSIENYHAKWVGAVCADGPKMKPGPEDEITEGWEKRALERRAQQLAEKLAEDLFLKRAEELTRQAKQIVTSGPPPCECKKMKKATDDQGSAVSALSCFVEQDTPFRRPHSATTNQNKTYNDTPAFWKRTYQDVTQLKLQIEALKKESIKKEDLKLMEEKIAKIINQAAGPENEDFVTKDVQSIVKDNASNLAKNNRKETKHTKNMNLEELPRSLNSNKVGVARKRMFDANSSNSKKYLANEKPTKQPKKYNYNQSYAVNLCLCSQKGNKNLPSTQLNTDAKSSMKPKSSKDVISQGISSKNSKPINVNFPQSYTDEMNSKASIEPCCGSDCKCLNKVPSYTSIDKLLDALCKWKYDLNDPPEEVLNNARTSLDSKSFSNKNSKSTSRNKAPHDSRVSFPTLNYKEQDSNIEIHSEVPQKNSGGDKIDQLLNFNIAATTASEYMADVSLDKNNDFASKYINTIDSSGGDELQIANKNVLNGNLGCKCNNMPSNEYANNVISKVIQKSKSKDLVTVLNGHKKKKLTELNVLTNSKSTKVVEQKQNKKKNEIKEIVPNDEKDILPNETKKTELLPNNFDYYIKFLGVTLADTDSHKMTRKGPTGKKQSPPSLNKYKENYEENHKEMHDTKTPLLFSESSKEENDYDSFSQTRNCECNSKLEDFQSFRSNFFNEQFDKKSIQQKGSALGSQGPKRGQHSADNCVCCKNFKDWSKDLEVNAFHLLEDHLKEKLKEFKIFSCNSSCIPPDEEDKIFSTILNKVKQVISDCANEAKCYDVGLTTGGSWKRAYGLLQEYLKIKLKRVQCSQFLSETKDAVLPNILEKVCHMIEQDFERLKEICKCTKDDGVLTKKSFMEHLLLPQEEWPEKDSNTFKNLTDRRSTVRIISRTNSVKHHDFVEEIPPKVFPDDTKSCDIITEAKPDVKLLSSKYSSKREVFTMSSQVPHNLGMKTISCDVMETDNKSKDTETNSDFLNKIYPGFIYNACECNYDPKKTGHEMLSLRNQHVLFGFRADVLINSNSTMINKKQPINELGFAKSMPDFKCIEEIKCNYIFNQEIKNNSPSINGPCIGCTIDCTCHGNLDTCVCTKSAIQGNPFKISSNWKQLIANNKKCIQDLSYIMSTAHNKTNNDNISCIDNGTSLGLPPHLKQQDCNHISEAETDVHNEDVVLILSREHTDTRHGTTNTLNFNKNTSFGTDSRSSLDWCEYHQSNKVGPIQDIGNIADSNLANSLSIYEAINECTKSCRSGTTTDTITCKSSQECNCDRVPICHVKMLVENIERNITESKCTCDLISKICPMHSKKNQEILI